MRRHLENLALALILTLIGAIGTFAEVGSVQPYGWLATLLSTPLLPAAFVIAMLGIGRGPDGFPTHADVSVYVASVAFWVLVISEMRALVDRRRIRSTEPGVPGV